MTEEMLARPEPGFTPSIQVAELPRESSPGAEEQVVLLPEHGSFEAESAPEVGTKGEGEGEGDGEKWRDNTALCSAWRETLGSARCDGGEE